MKLYDVYYAGGEKIKTIKANTILEACEEFIEQLNKKVKIELRSKDYASIRYADNYCIGGNFVILKK